MKNLKLSNSKEVIMNLIKQDFQMMNLFDRLDHAGFIGLDFPSITYEIFDLMEIPEELRTDQLFDTYDQWSQKVNGAKNHKKIQCHLEVVYSELDKFRELYSVP